jgi:hypothetical protein
MLEGHSLSFVLLSTSKMPSAQEVRSAWLEILNDVVPPTEKTWGDDSVELELDGILTIVTLMPLPIPNQEAEAAASTSLSALRDGGFSPGPHVAHLLIASTSTTQSPVQRLLRHTRVVAAFTKACRAVGVYEGNACATHDPSFYVDVVAEGSELPLMLWTGVSIAKTDATVELLTLGMRQLDLPDLLLVAPSGQGNDALPFAFELLGYVISRGRPISDGETVGRTADEKIPVTYSPSPIKADTLVMRVELPGLKKRWWKFGKN